MARSIWIEFPGAFYHVMARGNRREAIFKDDLDHDASAADVSRLMLRATSNRK